MTKSQTPFNDVMVPECLLGAEKLKYDIKVHPSTSALFENLVLGAINEEETLEANILMSKSLKPTKPQTKNYF